MKRWTVMLVPQSRGRTRSLELAAYQIGVLVAVLMTLSFSSTFFYKRHQVLAREVSELRGLKQDIRLQKTIVNGAAPASDENLSGKERAEIEEQARRGYEATMARITAELGKLYEFEAEARQLVGYVKQEPEGKKKPVKAIGGGKGGGLGSLDLSAYVGESDVERPPQVIYGLSRPSADLILQEINLRTASLERLVADLNSAKDRLDRMPSITPLLTRAQRRSSGFGYRQDPFTHRLRHHDGGDISGPYGATVVATAQGVVTSSGWDSDLGKTVHIDHGDGVETVYAHLQECLVKEGQTVKRSDPIGKLGNTGRSTGAHLHYEVHINGKVVDPFRYMALSD